MTKMEHGNVQLTELQQVKRDAPGDFEEAPNESPRKLQFSCNSTCSFLKQEYNKSDAAKRSKTTVKLCGLIIFYTIIMVIEIVGGLRANSLAILTDAAHLLSDIAGFCISLFTLIWLISGTLIYEAVNRLITRVTKVDGKLMFAIAVFGFLVNFLLVLWLGHDHSHHHHSHHACKDNAHDDEAEGSCRGEGDESMKLVSTPHGKTEMLNINIQGAYLHLVTDLIQSVGVMIAGCIIWIKPKWLVIDLICTLIFSIIALGTTLPMLKDIFYILMERAPSEVDIVALENGLKLIRGVGDVHDLHVWDITMGKHVLACHVVTGSEVDPNKILQEIREYCEGAFGIYHVTIQIERE
ncbi:metal tolerance protein B isoform X2 [Sesamum indicum]|uniref:Metal tolerance protein B isoform X2 n=1 Tax=Sesamum indicum TaxID=4182 RepID=A0A6I9U6P2_SESIN|nr:metal tolerance protein B isoform X2 [Sesamum indicum]